MIKFLTLRQFVCPLSLFLKEIPFASLTNAIDVKIERVLTGFLIGWTIGKELWERKSLQILCECWRRAYHALLAQLFIIRCLETYCFCSVYYYYYSSFFPWNMNLSTAVLRNYRTEFHETWWSYRYMFLVDPKVFRFVVKGGQSHIFGGSKGVRVTIESYGKILYINVDNF